MLGHLIMITGSSLMDPFSLEILLVCGEHRHQSEIRTYVSIIKHEI